MDELEKNVKNNRLKFDTSRPNKAKMWDAIEDELDQEPHGKIVKFAYKKYLSIAALLLVFFTSYGVFRTSSDTNILSSELVEIDSHYKGLLNYQIKLVSNSKLISQADKDSFYNLMKELDVEHDALIKELETNIDNEIILEAIIINYRKRIEFLERILKRINRNKQLSYEKDIQI